MHSLERGLVYYCEGSLWPAGPNIARLLNLRSSGDTAWGSTVVLRRGSDGQQGVLVANATNSSGTFTSPVAPNAMAAAHSIYCRYSIATSGQVYVFGITNAFQLISGYVSGQLEMFTAGNETGDAVRTSSGMAFPADSKTRSACFTYDGATQRGYIDGSLLVTNAKTYSLTSTATSSVINGTGSGNRFDGVVERCGIWNRTLTKDEIIELDSNPLWWIPQDSAKIEHLFVSSASFKAWLNYYSGIRNV